MKKLEEIRDMLSKGCRPVDAIAELDLLVAAEPDNEPAILERGMLHWGCGNRALAINDFHAAIALNPESLARQALQNANDILDYYNKDLYNP
ncbi:MAG: hypothetical protein II308_09515 [Muribaculaceae bacterium]|jgi:lipoprotein NlpI|nr:hypothetical protein [Muribaculaceae bacterium]MBO7165700.1 hypothetical protein [Muribaculaceae bacterium]MBQ2400288.1 hypothetical protein [Muribaculaceae bacterium]MBR4885725.1 hypothetical protein [Muribaculaceae bacterium]MBR5788257.1 hypothetical protein [Muribaculaceae bacterium]